MTRILILTLALFVAGCIPGCLQGPQDGGRQPDNPAIPSGNPRTTYSDLFEELAWQVEEENINSGAELIRDAGGALSRSGLSPPSGYDEAMRPWMDGKKKWNANEAARVLRGLKK